MAASPGPVASEPVFPREHLLPDETIVFETRPNPVAFVLPGAIPAIVLFLVFLIPFGLFAFSAGVPFGGGAFFWVAFLLVLTLLPALMQIVRYSQTAYAVTSKRILSTTGIIGRTVVQCTHDRVQNVTFHQGLVGRMTGSGSLVFSTAGMGFGMYGNPFLGGGMPMLGGNVAFVAIPDPVGAKRIADQVVEESRRAARTRELREMTAAVAAAGPGLRFCPFCGVVRIPNATHCGQCGARFPG